MESTCTRLTLSLSLSFSPAVSYELHCLFLHPFFSFFSYLHVPLTDEHIARTAAFAETTSLVRIVDLRSKKFQAAQGGSTSSLLISCVDGVQSNQSIIAPISAGGGSYLAVTCTNNSLVLPGTRKYVLTRDNNFSEN